MRPRLIVGQPGDKNGRLTVVSEFKRGAAWRLNCLCECGKTTDVGFDNFYRYRTAKSCGCLPGMGRQRHYSPELPKRLRDASEYVTWMSMIQRCTNPKAAYYANYGGRGITVCPEWRTSFKAFYDYMGPKPSPQHSIDRYPDNDDGYRPGNVRWATRKEQANNKRRG